ncbi:MAG: tripartite tricarboxylate transporter substrate-binding protein [Polaromonas sp.]|nr:tripartite tricarboxylate transporter substrate-binding protein [Polaromonas sp.]
MFKTTSSGSPEFGRSCKLLVALLVTSMAALSQAAEFPERTVEMVVGVGPGGGTDMLGRTFAKKLNEVWQQPVVVENKPGAGGIIGAQTVMKAPATGYTLLMNSDQTLAAQFLYKRPDYEPLKQLAPIAYLGRQPYVFVVHPSVPVNNVPELIALMKSKKAKGESFGFATSALGSADHLSGELFRIAAGVDMLVVPYKSSTLALTDVVAGHLPFDIAPLATTLPYIKAGRLRALGITTSKRSKLLPDLPTVSETLPGFETGVWYGLWAPAGTPARIIEKINADVQQINNSADVQSFMEKNGYETLTMNAAEYADFVKKESTKIDQLIRKANVKLE